MSKYSVSSLNVLKKTVKQRDEEYTELKNLLQSLQGKERNKSQINQIKGAYSSLFDLETKIKRNINDHYYKIIKMKKGANEQKKFEAYQEYIKDNPLKKYTGGTKKFTNKKELDILTGKTSEFAKPKLPVMSPDDRDKQEKAGKEESKEESKEDDKEDTTKGNLQDQAEIDAKTGESSIADETAKNINAIITKKTQSTFKWENNLVKYVEKTDNKLYLRLIERSDKLFADLVKDRTVSDEAEAKLKSHYFNQALAELGENQYNNIVDGYEKDNIERVRTQKQLKADEELEKKKKEMETKVKAQHAKMEEQIKNFTGEQDDKLEEFLNDNPTNDVRSTAFLKMMEAYGEDYKTFADREKLFRYFQYKMMSEHSGENTAHKVKSETQPQDAKPDILTDQDGDGDIDRDDFVEKFGKEGKTGVRGATGKKELETGKFSEDAIQDAINEGISRQSIAKGMEKELGDTGKRTGVLEEDDPRIFGRDTQFEGDMSGIDQELNLGDMGGQSAPVSGSSAVDVKSNILNQFESNTVNAGEVLENTLRSEKKIDELKKEINCFHQIYEDLIKGFKSKEHQEDYKKVLESNNLDEVRKHHEMMMKMIRAYYKTSDLKLGVIMSAESIFGGSVGNIPSMMGSFGIGLPVQRTGGKNPTLIDRKRGKDRFSNATAGEKQVIRGGVNSKKGVRQAIPRDIDKSAYIDKLNHPDYAITDAFRPRSYIRRRVHTNPEVKLKVSKH